MSQPSRNRIRSQLVACAEVLRQVLEASLRDGRPADRALNYVFKRNRQYGSRDRRLIAESVFSVFRWLGWLCELPGVPSELPDKIPEDGLASDALYRLLSGAWFLDASAQNEVLIGEALGALGVPVSASSFDAAPSPTERFKGFLQWFDAELREPEMAGLLPAWSRQECCSPLAWEDMALAFQTRPPIYIRLQGDSERDASTIAWLEGEGAVLEVMPPPFRAVRLKECPVNLYQSALFKAGAFELQDAASQVVGLVCAAQARQRWWDCCAGAGGKSLQLADLLGGRGYVLASDVREYKLKDSRTRARRAGFSNIACKPWNGHRLPCKPASFDGVLVDAPCSCSGTWRRNPDGRWTTHLEDVEEMQCKQLHILNRAKAAVRCEGRMVYATCSIFTRENEAVVQEFLRTNSDFELLPFTHPLTGQECGGTLRVWPWQLDSDGMFIANMRRA